MKTPDLNIDELETSYQVMREAAKKTLAFYPDLKELSFQVDLLSYSKRFHILFTFQENFKYRFAQGQTFNAAFTDLVTQIQTHIESKDAAWKEFCLNPDTQQFITPDCQDTKS